MAVFTVWTILCFYIAVTFSTGEASPKVTMTANVTHGLHTLQIVIYGTPAILMGIMFQCNISSDEDLTDYVYDIQWFINDNSIVTHRNIPYTNLTQTGLHQSEWTDSYRLGFLIKCAVRARSETDSTPSPYTYSDAFYAGIETDLPEYTVPENGSINITIRLTVPIDCIYPTDFTPEQIESMIDNHCKVTIWLLSPRYYNDELECAYNGTTDEPTSFEHTQCLQNVKFNEREAPITIYGMVDGITTPSSSRTNYIRLTIAESIYSRAWNYATIPDIKVTVLDDNVKLSGRTCSITTGPFINTFDGRHVRFLQYGEFVVYIHNSLPIRIHAVFDRCWHTGRGACICGLAIRYMDAVFVLNFCKERIGAQWQQLSNVNRYVELKTYGNGCMEIEYRSSTYKVTLSSGTVITIGVHLDGSNAHINAVVIKPSLADWEATSGMCGLLDGDPDNDIMLRSGVIIESFGDSWRRNTTLDGDSLFVSDIVLRDIPLKPVRIQYCSCPHGSSYRSPNQFAQCNMNANTAVCAKRTDVEINGQRCDTYRAKKTLGYIHRDNTTTEDDIEVSIHDVVMDEKYQNTSQSITWTNDWNESLAEEVCRTTIYNDPMLIRCKDAVSGMDDVVTNGINECIVNIMIFGQTGYMEGTLKALQEHCLVEAEYIVTQESDGISKAVLDELKQLSCPHDCSGNGNCIDGTCHCHTGFYGNACTLEHDTVPGVLSGGMTCLVDSKPCKNFVVAGSDFLNVSLTCLVRPITVYSDRWEIVGPSIAFLAKYVNDFNCICNIPDFICKQQASDGEEVFAGGYLLSVSNDGDRFSNETAILTYDSRCYECDATHINCTKVVETCLSTGTFNTTAQPTDPYPLENETGPPNVTMIVEITHGIKTSSIHSVIRKEIVFHCNITTDLCITDHVYDIQWFINDNSIVTHRNIPFTNLTQTGLHQSEWTDTYRLGFLVKCAVRARTHTDSTPTLYTYSDDFYAGFKTDQSEYSVPEDSSINITIRLSVPLDCMYMYIPDCTLRIRIKTPNYYDTNSNIRCTNVGTVDEPIVFSQEACGISIKYSDWDVPKTMTIYGSADNIVTSSSSRTSYIRLVAENSFTCPAWAFATIPDIKVNVLDEDKKLLGKSCTIQTDPHINTLDGRHVLFMLYGEFILFKHDTLPIRIHAVFDKCWQAWRGSCTCGVAIRYMDAVFVLNFCKERIGEPWLYASNVNRYVEMRACDGTHMKIKYTRPAYKVTLPSGTEIHIGLHLGAINTHINMFILKPSLADWEATSGMCGFLDGDPDNDIRLRTGEVARGFGTNWRHDNETDGDSMFASNGVLRDILLPPLRYCSCPVTSDLERAFTAVANCNLTSTITTCASLTNYKNYFEQCITSQGKQDISGNLHQVRRSTDEGFEIPKFDIFLDEKYANSEYNITWINGWNESLAEEACRDTMDNDPMVTKCKNAVSAMNDITSNGINECVGDIKISGHTGYMEGTLKALRDHCLIEAIRFENLTTQESNGTNTTFLNELLKLSCPNNCSGNGRCEKGMCDCQDGFYGDSCTLGIETIPEVLSSGMICFIEQRSCRRFVIPGSNFLDVNLTCQVRMMKVYINRWEISGSPVLFPATYLNDFNCVCTIPESHRRRRATDNEVLSEGYLLSISNDGIHFSNETTILTYDSTCYDCDPTNLNCSKLVESCDSTTTATGTSVPSTLKVNPLTPAAIFGCVIGIVVILGIAIAVGIIIKLKCFHEDNTVYTEVTELSNMSFNEKTTRVQNNVAEPSNADYQLNESGLEPMLAEVSPIDSQEMSTSKSTHDTVDDATVVTDLEENQY